jgi:hypothetical protein
MLRVQQKHQIKKKLMPVDLRLPCRRIFAARGKGGGGGVLYLPIGMLQISYEISPEHHTG